MFRRWKELLFWRKVLYIYWTLDAEVGPNKGKRIVYVYPLRICQIWRKRWLRRCVNEARRNLEKLRPLPPGWTPPVDASGQPVPHEVWLVSQEFQDWEEQCRIWREGTETEPGWLREYERLVDPWVRKLYEGIDEWEALCAVLPPAPLVKEGEILWNSANQISLKPVLKKEWRHTTIQGRNSSCTDSNATNVVNASPPEGVDAEILPQCQC